MTDWIVKTVRDFGYIGVALLTFLENLFPPIPSELIMPLAGYLSADGDMNLPGVIAAGSVGAFVGAVAWYMIGRRVGRERLREWVDRHGHWLTMSCEDLDKAEDFLKRHGVIVVLLGRLIPGVRTWISVPAGLTEMNAAQFLLYTALGTGIWTAVLTLAGYALGSQFRDIGKYLGAVSTGVFVLIGVWYVYRLVQFFRQRRAQPE